MHVNCKKIFASVLLLGLISCGPQTSDYAKDGPTFDPKQFFNDSFKSWGVFEDYSGHAIKRFSTESSASWNGTKGQMHEHFMFTDGTTGERQWQFTQTDDHHVIGTAPDVVGDAVGEFYGNALHWTYNIKLDVHGTERVVHFDDWLYLIDDHHMFSEIKITKFGLPVGHLTMFFEKP